MDVSTPDAEPTAARAGAGAAGRRRDLTQGPITRTLLQFALPIMASNALQSLNGTVNQFWVSHSLGDSAVAALGNANIVMMLLIGSIYGVSMVANILIAQNVGARNFVMVKRVMGSSISFFFGLSLCMAVVGVLVAPHILDLMNTPPEARAEASIYLRILFAAAPFLYFFSFLQMAQQGAGDSRTPFYFMTLAVLLDGILNPLLIRGVGPFPRLGIAGSAISTLIAQAVALACLILYLYRRRSVLMLRGGELAYLKPDFKIIGALVTRGLPMGLQMFIMSGGAIVVMGFVNRYGAVTSAAFSMASVVWSYVLMPSFALGASVSSVAAQNIGAGRWDRVNAVARSGVLTGLAVTGGGVLLLYAFNTAVLSLLLPRGSPALPIAEHIMMVVLWGYVAQSPTFALNGLVRSTGAVWGPIAIMVFSVVVLRVAFAGLLMPYWGPEAIWWSFPVSSTVATLLAALYYKFAPWRTLRMIKEEPRGQVADTGLMTPAMDPPEADERAAEVMAKLRAETPREPV